MAVDTSKGHEHDDEATLAELGYKQELHRGIERRCAR
jgi:hypothetical protein